MAEHISFFSCNMRNGKLGVVSHHCVRMLIKSFRSYMFEKTKILFSIFLQSIFYLNETRLGGEWLRYAVSKREREKEIEKEEEKKSESKGDRERVVSAWHFIFNIFLFVHGA